MSCFHLYLVWSGGGHRHENHWLLGMLQVSCVNMPSHAPQSLDLKNMPPRRGRQGGWCCLMKHTQGRAVRRWGQVWAWCTAGREVALSEMSGETCWEQPRAGEIKSCRVSAQGHSGKVYIWNVIYKWHLCEFLKSNLTTFFFSPTL